MTTDDAEAYIEVTAVNGITVSFTSLDESDADKILFMLDTIPFSVAELPAEEAGTVDSTTVDNAARTAMGLSTDPEVEKGDFVGSMWANLSTKISISKSLPLGSAPTL